MLVVILLWYCREREFNDMTKNATADVFISYASEDTDWAEWIGWVLEEEGYMVVLQKWDFLPGSNFILQMHQASRSCRHTMPLLSPAFISSHYTDPEWAAALAEDPTGEAHKLIPVRVRECVIDGLLKPIVWVDLVGKDENTAREKVVSSILGERLKPVTRPQYPSSIEPAGGVEPVFPTCDEGLLDLVDRGTRQLQEANQNVESFAREVQDLGTSAAKHAERFRRIGDLSGNRQRASAKQIAQSAARDMNVFAKRGAGYVQQFSDLYEHGFGAWSAALHLLQDFGSIDKEVLSGNIASLDGMLKSIPKARQATKELRDVTARLPRIESLFAIARKKAADVLDGGVRALDRVEFLARRTRGIAVDLLDHS